MSSCGLIHSLIRKIGYSVYVCVGGCEWPKKLTGFWLVVVEVVVVNSLNANLATVCHSGQSKGLKLQCLFSVAARLSRR